MEASEIKQMIGLGLSTAIFIGGGYIAMQGIKEAAHVMHHPDTMQNSLVFIPERTLEAATTVGMGIMGITLGGLGSVVSTTFMREPRNESAYSD